MVRAAGLLAALTLLLTSCSTFRTSVDQDDLWWATDKAQHLSLSAATALGTTWTTRAAGAPTWSSAAAGLTFTLAGGLLKELWDATGPDGSGWSWKDLAFDLAGATAGTCAGTQLPTP